MYLTGSSKFELISAFFICRDSTICGNPLACLPAHSTIIFGCLIASNCIFFSSRTPRKRICYLTKNTHSHWKIQELNRKNNVMLITKCIIEELLDTNMLLKANSFNLETAITDTNYIRPKGLHRLQTNTAKASEIRHFTDKGNYICHRMSQIKVSLVKDPLVRNPLVF